MDIKLKPCWIERLKVYRILGSEFDNFCDGNLDSGWILSYWCGEFGKPGYYSPVSKKIVLVMVDGKLIDGKDYEEEYRVDRTFIPVRIPLTPANRSGF